jgi:transcriptional regulator with XRE-family HTH domain
VAEEIKDKIRELRRYRGWTQQQLADRLRVQQSTVCRWENGTSNPAGLYLVQLMRLLQGKRVR